MWTPPPRPPVTIPTPRLPTRRSSSLGVPRNTRNVLLNPPAPSLPASAPARPSGFWNSSSRSSSPANGPPRWYLLHTRLEVKLPLWSKYYPGRCSAVNADGTLLVAFEDGDLRDCVKLEQVCFDFRTTTSHAPARKSLRGNDQVEVLTEGRWYPGTIVEVGENERYAVRMFFGVGEVQRSVVADVPRESIRCFVPINTGLIPDEDVELLVEETRMWIKGNVDESGRRVVYYVATNSLDQQQQHHDLTSPNTRCERPVEDLILRYPITNPPRSIEDEDSADATPMILSMQERLSQSIDVGDRVLITDKNGGALPKIGKADSAQVSIINFPLPADGLFETVTLRLFEPPADETRTLDVVLFDREQIGQGPNMQIGPSPTRRRMSSSSSFDSSTEGGGGAESSAIPALSGGTPSAPGITNTTATAQQQQGTATDPSVIRFFVAPDLPYRPSRSQIMIDPHSRGVQILKLSIPLRGSAGQYLGIMNRSGRLNIAYTPDKKKPVESWSEKSVEVFYMMPRMVPRPFVGGPHATRDWHGRAGWFASMIVSDPGEAVDPGWQRRCESDALTRKDGGAETKRVGWMVISLVKRGKLSSRKVLFEYPKFIHALTRLCELDDSVVELITTLCEDALKSGEERSDNFWGSSQESTMAITRLQRALRFKAFEMQVVQRGRLTSSFEKFQRILRCLLAMKRLHEKDSTNVRFVLQQQPQQLGKRITSLGAPPSPPPQQLLKSIRVFRLKPRPLFSSPPILYALKKNDTLVVSSLAGFTEQGINTVDICPGDELVLSKSAVMGGASGNEQIQFEEMLQTNGPFVETQTPYFGNSDAASETLKRIWKTWTAPLDLKFQRYLDANGCDDSNTLDFLSSSSSSGNATTVGKSKRDWFDDLERATELLDTFGRGAPPPDSFVREHFFHWQQYERRARVESAHPLMVTKDQEWIVRIANASRLKLEWSSSSRFGEFDGSCLIVSNGSKEVSGRCAAPPPLDWVEGDCVTIRLRAAAKPFDPSELLLTGKKREQKDFPLAKGLLNSLGDAPRFVIVDRNGVPKFACTKCLERGQLCCNANGSPPENNEGRFVSPFPSRNSWVCSACVALPAPCASCAAFPHSVGIQPVCARTRESFEDDEKYETFLKQCLVPSVPVIVGSGGRGPLSNVGIPEKRFVRIQNDGLVVLYGGGGGGVGGPSSTMTLPLDKIRLSPSVKWLGDEGEGGGGGCAGSNNNLDQIDAVDALETLPTAAAPFILQGGTFAINDLGPDIAISNMGLTVTRLRSMGWGTQRMSRFLDASCGTTTITFRIDRNSSNHLFFGVVAPTFTDWMKRLMEPGAWSIRRDGSTHADGRERSSATPNTHLITGEMLMMIVDMQSEPRSVSFIQNGVLLEKLQNLPPRVVPAVSFGGSNQVVSITSFSLGGEEQSTGEVEPQTSAAATMATVVTMVPTAPPTPRRGRSLRGKRWGFAVDVIPEFDVVNEHEIKFYLEETHMLWTNKMDHLLVLHCDEICHERKIGLMELLEKGNNTALWNKVFCQPNRFYMEALLMENPKLNLKIVGRRFEWIRSFNASVAKALPLLDLNFDTNNNPATQNLGKCAHLFFQILKRPMWEDALETTRTEQGQFEVVLDYGKAMAHRQFCDSNANFTVFSQAFRTMHFMPSSRLRGQGQLYRCTMRGMRAHDDGGPYRQSFHTYCAELLSVPGTGLFLPCANRVNEIYVNRDRWLPNPNAKSPLAVSMFEFVGKLMGIAVRNSEYLDLRLPSMVWKKLCNQQVTLEDLRAVDLLFVNAMEDVRVGNAHSAAAGITDGTTFTLPSLDGRIVEICPGGSSRVLDYADPANCEDWVSRACAFKLHEFDEQIESIRRGMHCIVPQRMLVIFTWEELELMVCGRPKIDLQLLREMTVYVGCSEYDAHIRAFWNVLQSFTEERKSLYLRFVWGRSRLPTSKSAWGDMFHKISTFEVGGGRGGGAGGGVDDMLPRSHTCYFSLDLPRYTQEDILKKKLLFAIENCTEIDADQTTTGNRSAAMGFELEVDADDDVDVVNAVGGELGVNAGGGGGSVRRRTISRGGSISSETEDVVFFEDDDFEDDVHEIIGPDLAQAIDSFFSYDVRGAAGEIDFDRE